MSELREAAQAVVAQWDVWDPVVHTGVLIDRLRAALAQPESRPCTCHPDDNPPQPCAQRYALTECKALAQPEAEAATGDDLRVYDAIAANYANPPRDEWRPASDSPDTTRSVLIWLRFGDVETFGKTLGGPSGFAFQNGAITHWRDVTPPTEGEQ